MRTDTLDIGLVNNMPDAALDATERQFRALLDAAAGDFTVRLTLYTLPDVPRTDFGRRQVSRYASFEDLWARHHDGLIVTGTEPQAADLKDEPFWGSLTRLLEWAERNTHSTVLSCLAAHAGILHIDGIVRRPLGDKRFGIFECVRVSDHPLTAAAPEYEAVTLMLEYRRDIGRFLREERETYPPMPLGYFDEETVAALTALRERALLDRREELLAEFPTAMAAGKVANTWRSTAESFYRNWLLFIHAQKELTDDGRVAVAVNG